MSIYSFSSLGQSASLMAVGMPIGIGKSLTFIGWICMGCWLEQQSRSSFSTTSNLWLIFFSSDCSSMFCCISWLRGDCFFVGRCFPPQVLVLRLHAKGKHSPGRHGSPSDFICLVFQHRFFSRLQVSGLVQSPGRQRSPRFISFTFWP